MTERHGMVRNGMAWLYINKGAERHGMAFWENFFLKIFFQNFYLSRSIDWSIHHFFQKKMLEKFSFRKNDVQKTSLTPFRLGVTNWHRHRYYYFRLCKIFGRSKFFLLLLDSMSWGLGWHSPPWCCYVPWLMPKGLRPGGRVSLAVEG